MAGLLLATLLERCNTPVPEEVRQKSDATPGLDLSYLQGQALTETEEALLKIATTDDDPLLEYTDLYVHQKNHLVSQLDIRFESQQPKDIIGILKSTLLAELLFRKKVFADQESCHKFSKLAVRIFPNDSMTQLFELGETVSPLAKTNSLFVEAKESETILRVAKILKEADRFWLSLPPEHQYKKIPIHEIVSTFFDNLNSGEIKIRYTGLDSSKIGEGGNYSDEDKTLTLHKNFNETLVVHETTHAWQDFKTHGMSHLERETQAILVSAAYGYYNQETLLSETEKRKYGILEHGAKVVVQCAEKISNAGDPKKIKEPLRSIAYLKDYLAIEGNIGELGLDNQDVVHKKLELYLQSRDVVKKREFIDDYVALGMTEFATETSKQAIKAVQQNFSAESVDQLQKATRFRYNNTFVGQADTSLRKVIDDTIKRASNNETLQTDYENRLNLFFAQVERERAFSGYNVVTAYLAQMFKLAVYGKTQEAMDYFDLKIKPLINGPVELRGMDSATARELWEKRK